MKNSRAQRKLYKKLALNRETIRELTGADLAQAAGHGWAALTAPTRDGFCPPNQDPGNLPDTAWVVTVCLLTCNGCPQPCTCEDDL